MNHQDKHFPQHDKTTSNLNQTLSTKRWHYSTASQTRLKALAEFKTWYFQQMKTRT